MGSIMFLSQGKQQGFLSLVAILLIVAVGFVGLAITYMVVASFRSSSDTLNATQAFYLAESGLQQAIHKLVTPTLANRSACSGLSFNNNLGGGAYSVSATGPSYSSSATSLNGALAANSTTISVASTSGYTSSGRIMIDRELINYASVNANNFLGATRGVDGTTAAAHASGASVGQYQCTLTAQGGVSSLTTPTSPGNPFGKRSLQEAVQLQEGWVVANQVNNNVIMAHWNRPTELQWTNASTASSTHPNLSAVFLLSYADGWAVGQHTSAGLTLLHWNGSTWTAASVAGTADLNGVYCNSSNDCWAVGLAQSNYPTLRHYDGSTWSLVTPTAQANATANDVFCNSSSDCWAVGDALKKYPLMEHYDGISWSLVTPTAQANVPANSVYCNSSSDCWAVGNVLSGNPLIEHYDGSSWSRTLPSASVNGNLYSVYCNASNDCWAVGQHLAGNLLFIEHWNGSSWSASSPGVSGSNDLFGVACTASNDCWAVGQNATYLHWNGSGWSAVSAPSGFPSNATINSISLLGPGTKPQAAWQELFS